MSFLFRFARMDSLLETKSERWSTGGYTLSAEQTDQQSSSVLARVGLVVCIETSSKSFQVAIFVKKREVVKQNNERRRKKKKKGEYLEV